MLRRLSSARLAAVLIGALVVLCVVSFVVPQRSHSLLTLHAQWAEDNPALARVARVTGADDVFGSPAFFVVLSLLALNLVACTTERTVRRVRRHVRVPDVAPSHASSIRTTLDAAEAAYTVASGFPLWGRTRIDEDSRTYLLLDGGRWGFVGSIVLHAGILLLIMAGLVSGLTRFDGRLVLTVGETLSEERSSYFGEVREPVLGQAHDGSAITLESLRFDYEDGFLTQAHGRLTFRDGRSAAVEEAVVNYPARWRGKSYLMVKGGHAVRVEVRDASGAPLFPEAYVRLGQVAEGGYRDEIELADGRRLALATTADAGRPERAEAEPLRLGDPALRVSLAGEDPGESVRLRPGESAPLGGLEVGLGAVTLWNEFAVRQDKGILPAYAAFGVILLGSAMRFGFGRRKVGCLVTATAEGSLAQWWSSDGDAEKRVRGVLAAYETKGTR